MGARRKSSVCSASAAREGFSCFEKKKKTKTKTKTKHRQHLACRVDGPAHFERWLSFWLDLDAKRWWPLATKRSMPYTTIVVYECESQGV